MKIKIKLAKPYDKILTTDKTTVVMYSPRISGKSYALGEIIYIYANKYPEHDIIVTRANYNSLEDSLYNEILAFAVNAGHHN